MSLIRNVGSTDKIIRIVAGAVLGAWGLLGAGITTAFGLIAVVAGVILLATGLINFCPIFKLLGISSTSKSTES